MKEPKVKLDDHPCYIGNDINFWGALNVGYDAIKKWRVEANEAKGKGNKKVKDKDEGWAPDTQSTYNGYFNQLWEPLDQVPLKDLDQEMVEKAIADIQEKRRKQGKRKPYSEGVLHQMFFLVRLVVKYAVEKGFIPEDFLWGAADLVIGEGTHEESWATERVVLRKSLGIQEEIAVAEALLTDPYQPGKYVGLLLMFALGLRNNEACGVQYCNIMPLRAHPECHVLYISLNTVDSNGNVKSGGKTSNAYRILPLPDKVYRRLMERKKWLEDQVASGELILPSTESSVDELYIANKDDDLLRRCRPADLSKAAKQLFRGIHMDEKQLAYIELAMRNQQLLEEMGMQEKDPTAYLFRRNLGTHLSILGLTQSEIEYFMGHVILDEEVQRNDFTNEDRLYEIAQKMRRRPLLNDGFDRPERIDAVKNRTIHSHAGSKKHNVCAQLEEGDSLVLRIEADEPGQELYFRIEADDEEDIHLKDVICETYERERQEKKEVSVLADYHAGYRRELKK